MRKYHVLHNPKARKKPARRSRKKNPSQTFTWLNQYDYSDVIHGWKPRSLPGSDSAKMVFRHQDEGSHPVVMDITVWEGNVLAEIHDMGGAEAGMMLDVKDFGPPESDTTEEAFHEALMWADERVREEGLLATGNPRKRKTTKRKATKKRTSSRSRRKNPDTAWETPRVGEVDERSLKGHPKYKIRIYADETPADFVGALGEDAYFAQIIGPDGEVLGEEGGNEGRFGPYATSDTANAAADFIGNMLAGADATLQANPTQRKRLASKARRNLAKPNGLFDPGMGLPQEGLFGAQLSSPTTGPIEKEDLSKIQLMGLPQDAEKANALGYYFGILRGMDTCGWSPKKVWARRQYRKRLANLIIKSANDMQQAILSPDKVKKVPKVRR